MPDDQAGRGPTRLTGTETGTESDSLPDTRPGALRGQAWLTLQTRHAGRLIKGRPGSADKQPITGLLGFANPYAYRGAQLLASYDGFARRVLSAQYVGTSDPRRRRAAPPPSGETDSAGVCQCPRLSIPRHHPRGCRAGTAKAEQAVESMGAVPPEILSGEVRAELAPVRPESAADGMPAFPSTALQNAS